GTWAAGRIATSVGSVILTRSERRVTTPLLRDPRGSKPGKVGAEGGTRTPTGCPTRPSNVRVCQFRHFGASGRKVCPAATRLVNEAAGNGRPASDRDGGRGPRASDTAADRGHRGFLRRGSFRSTRCSGRT